MLKNRWRNKAWRRTGICTLALLWTGGVDSARADDAVERFALVIGNNQPETTGTVRLRYADDDAVSTSKLLREAGVYSVLLSRLDDDTRRLHPQLIPGGPPRGASFDAAVNELFARIRGQVAQGNKTELLIFYSGHGDVSGGEGYVLLEDRRIMRRDLHALLSRSPATYNHVFVDACKSYFLAFEKAAGGHRTSYARSFAPAAEPGRLVNVGFVLSTSSDRDSHEWERFQAGILSYELRSALRGGADVNGDGRVTYAELGAFLTRANGAIQNPRFRPDFLVRPPEANLRQEVFRWADTTSAAHFTPRAAGSHLYIENARGERILDAHAAPDQTLAVHIPADRPLFVRRHDETAEYVIRNATPITIAAIEGALPAVASRGALHLAFEQLFATPFGQRDVTMFESRADLFALEQDQADSGHAGWTARSTAGAIAIGGAVTALTLNAFALQRYVSSADASQQDIASSNQTIRRLNVASLVCYAIAGAAGATWGWLGRQSGLVVALDRPAGGADSGFALSFGAAF